MCRHRNSLLSVQLSRTTFRQLKFRTTDRFGAVHFKYSVVGPLTKENSIIWDLKLTECILQSTFFMADSLQSTGFNVRDGCIPLSVSVSRVGEWAWTIPEPWKWLVFCFDKWKHLPWKGSTATKWSSQINALSQSSKYACLIHML